MFIEAQLKTRSGDSSPLDSTEGFVFVVTIRLVDGDTIASTDAVTVTYAIGTDTGKTVELSVSTAIPALYIYTGDVLVKEGDNGVITFTKVSFKTSSTGATPIDYTTESTSSPVVSFSVEGGTTISAQTPIEDITDVTSVKVKTSASGDDTTVTNGESVNVDVVVVNAAEGIAVVDTDAVTGDATAHTLQYKIAGGASSDLALVRGDNNTHFTGMLAVDAMTAEGAFTFESVKLSLNNADGDATAEVKTYTVADTSILTLTDAGLTLDPVYVVTDVTSVAVGITSSGDDTAVTIGETVTVDVNVGNAMEGIAVVADGAMTGDATDHKLLYDVGASGTATEVTLLLGDNDTHFTVTLPAVADGDIAGAFTFESVKLSLNNADGDATTEVRTYTAVDTSILTLTDAGLTIDPSNAVTDVASVKVKISTSGDDTTVTNGESVNVDVVVVNTGEGVAVTGDATAHTLQYKITATGSSTDLALVRGDNDTHFTGMLTVGAMIPAGVFTFESVTLSLQNAAGDALSPKERTYTTEMTSAIVVTLTDAGLTIDPPEVTAVEVLANATAVDNKAEGGDKVNFTAWITNSTDGLPLNVTVNYKISGTKDVTGSVLLANQGLNETDSATNLWSGTLTLADNVTAGNLTIVSIVVWAKNMDSSLTVSMTFTAADAKATNVVKIEVPAPVDPPTANKTTSNTAATTASASTSASSSESSSDSPVSIFAMFILIASVTMAVGIYTLRRRQ